MTAVYVSIGSNIDREKHIIAALDALSASFGELSISPVYESESVGFSGEPFLNLAVGFETTLSLADLSLLLRSIEHANGRQRGEARFSARTLDIDILTWGTACGVLDGIRLPREEILQNAFVLLPMAELAPDAVHPESGKSYATLWSEYDQSRQKLWRVPFCWRNIQLGQDAITPQDVANE